MRKITHKQAEKIIKHIQSAFPAYVDGTPPIYRDWGDDGDLIIWEGGPFEWALIYSDLIAGYDRKGEDGITHKAVKPIRGFFIEPYYSYAVGVYRDA